MAKDIHWYIANGKSALSKKLGRPCSNRELSTHLGASNNAVLYWLDGTIPSEGIMIRFAEMMPQWVSREEALLDRKAWQAAKDPAVAAAWENIREGFKRAAPVAVLAGVFLLTGNDAHAAQSALVHSQNIAPWGAATIYIMRQTYCELPQWIPGTRGCPRPQIARL